MHQRDGVNRELARRLEAYAEARLSPALSATTRMRARVMAAAHRQAALTRADADRAASAAAPARAERMRRSPLRRSMTALIAAGLTLGLGVGSVAAAQPGGPLYGARIWAETLTLPSAANERAEAELRRLVDRLAEAAAATAAGDTNAAAAALDAFGSIVNEATHDAGNDVSAAATLDAGVRSNIDVLTVLVDRVPTEEARDAIQRAIDRSDSALDTLHNQPNGASPAGPPESKPTPEETDRTPNPNKPIPDPADPTPKPHPTPKHTPRGGPPAEPPGGGGNQGN